MSVDIIKNKKRPVEILLVEDNRGDIIIAKKAFAKATLPNNITVAVDGMQAMEILHRQGQYTNAAIPDIIFLDLNLPKKSGGNVLSEIKSDENIKHIPVIILSSSRIEIDVVRSYNLHANSYLVKPTSLENFSEIVSIIEKFWFSVAILPNGISPTENL